MRTTAVSALLALVAVQQAAANGMGGGQSWGDANSLPSCSNAPNQCNDQQKSGYDFTNANLPEGSCSGYGGMSFQGVATTSALPAPPAVPTTTQEVVTTEICLKTWVTVTKCKDNSDYDCFCQDDTFTQNVYECISSWESDQAQQQSAMSYYAGICAQHVPAHPAIVTAVPSTITLVPTPAAQTPGSAPPAANTPGPVGSPAPTSAPAAPPAAAATTAAPAPAAGTPAPAPQLPPTTISISTTVTLPCPVAPANQISDGQVQAQTGMPSGCTTTQLLTTQVTLPQVAFSTGASSSVGLVAGTPAPAQAAATGAPAAPAPAAPVPGVAGASSSAPISTPTSTVAPFKGAAARTGSSSMAISVVFAALGLFVFA
ncbi:hypothetical protein OEA41_010467 [Lepraria neglecta]|uniref:CFEM domain-containing protein n=1 Tax=Lepraria neglecta TaxID=209136 RepID=A0AAD9YXD8_9LECA|nr:hypothetical protein OEA41_010467 [Lepraria neglecta]